MMEYPAWRKKAQTPELVNFMRSYRLDQNHLDDTNKSVIYKDDLMLLKILWFCESLKQLPNLVHYMMT